MTDIKWTDLSTPDPEFQAFLDSVGGKLPSLSDGGSAPPPIAALRATIASADKPVVPGVTAPASMDGVEKSRITIPVRDGASIAAALYRPVTKPEAGSPLVVAFHGGGWCLGVPEMEEVNCVNAVQKYGAVAISVDYRLAPEHPFPTAINDSWDALKWIATNATSPAINADPATAGFVVHGESAGGNIAVVLALLARDEALSPPLTGVSASIPAVLAAEAVPERFKAEYKSHEQNKNAPGLDAGALGFFAANYNPDKSSPLFSPFNWPTGHKGLPPFFIQACGLDPLCDDALLFERLLRTEAGVKTKLVVYPGLPHSFWGFFPHLEASRKAVGKVVEGFGWLLGKA
ncbi:AB hydrolase superfamily protein B1A11.02 [Lasiodiplodia hormozganensis]|uniref:AB hydrolase superfamily protein B1A11.02 n=1 Tax=Lasiodiplodia hormozganensis TaxID=869390 RepID=A0AA40C5C4_9PEZI|nr:AB hydrolase superfamily protein B1A11.02 [Lasiodiplodia hormozganensis]